MNPNDLIRTEGGDDMGSCHAPIDGPPCFYLERQNPDGTWTKLLENYNTYRQLRRALNAALESPGTVRTVVEYRGTRTTETFRSRYDQ